MLDTGHNLAFFLETSIWTLIQCTVPKGYNHDNQDDDDQAEAEPPPTFRWLDAENQPVTDGQVVNNQYKVVHDDHTYDDHDL